VTDGSRKLETGTSQRRKDIAKAGDELRTVFRKTARDTDGELLQVDWIGEPGWTTGPEERFEVISGQLGLRVEGVERIYGAGEVIYFVRPPLAAQRLVGRIPLPLREGKRGFPDGRVTRRLSCELRGPDERCA
jgi:hypothetical protein